MEYNLIPRGKVYICGAGPGEPELLTVKAKRLLKTCDVILYDRLVTKEILELVPDRSRKIYVGRKSGDPTVNQRETNRLMLYFARAGKIILRLKGGDPFIFGRGGEEVEFLSSYGIECEVVPGISSFSAAAVYAKIPLTHRKISSSFALVTGHEDSDKDGGTVKWKKLAKSVDTIVVLMGIERIEKISKELISAGLASSTNVGIIENATTRKQRVILGKLGNIASKVKKYSVQPPSIIIIGKVVNVLRNKG
jgi:uroporphyrin-III C-methyltransferase